MKKINYTLLFILSVFLISLSFTSPLKTDKSHNQQEEWRFINNSITGVNIWGKIDEYGAWFKVENLTGQTLHVEFPSVCADWTDGKHRCKDVRITYIPVGQSREKRYNHTDNYSKLNSNISWGEIKWSHNLSDL